MVFADESMNSFHWTTESFCRTAIRTFERTPNAVGVVTVPDCELVYANEAFSKAMEYLELKGPSDSMSMCFWDLFPSAEDVLKSMYESVIESGEIARKDSYRYEHAGKEVFLDIVLIPNMNESGDRVETITVIGLDVTELNRAQQAVLEREGFMRSVLDSLPTHIAILDELGFILYTNLAWRRFGEENGVAMESHMIGVNYVNVCEAVSDNDAEIAAAAAQGIKDVTTGRLQEFAIEYSCHSPVKKRWFILRCKRVQGVTPTRVIVAHEDITTRKLAEIQAVESSEALRRQFVLLQRALISAVPDEMCGYGLAATYTPAYVGEEIGGDFYDVFKTEDSRIGLIIGDISGKGVEAASLAAATRSTIRAFAYDALSPGIAMTQANAVLIDQQASVEQFSTVFLVLIDPNTGDISYTSAGHPPALIAHPDGSVECLYGENIPVGLVEGYKYGSMQSKLEAGDKLVLYTDGISEARHDSELFGIERIEEAVSRYRRDDPKGMLAELVIEVTQWAQGRVSDDAALVVIERKYA